MTKAVVSLLLIIHATPAGVLAEGQPPKKVPRIAYVDAAGTPNAPEEAFKALDAGLRELGFVDGQNIVIDRRYAEGRLDRMPALLNELLQQKPDVFVAFNNVLIREVQKRQLKIFR